MPSYRQVMKMKHTYICGIYPHIYHTVNSEIQFLFDLSPFPYTGKIDSRLATSPFLSFIFSVFCLLNKTAIETTPDY